MTVAELLQAARVAHEDYRRNVPHMRFSVGKGKPEQVGGDAAKSVEAMREALRLRLEAEAADPNRLDPAWATDLAQNYRHASLTAWYQEKLASGA